MRFDNPADIWSATIALSWSLGTTSDIHTHTHICLGNDRCGNVYPWSSGLFVIFGGAVRTVTVHGLHPRNVIPHSVMYLQHGYVCHNGPVGTKPPISPHRRRYVMNQDYPSESRPKSQTVERPPAPLIAKWVTNRQLPRSHDTIKGGGGGTILP